MKVRVAYNNLVLFYLTRTLVIYSTRTYIYIYIYIYNIYVIYIHITGSNNQNNACNIQCLITVLNTKVEQTKLYL